MTDRPSFHIGPRPVFKPEVVARRQQQDALHREFHAALDLAAQDTHVKSERPSFAVVGEGSASAQENYRRGYDHVHWRD